MTSILRRLPRWLNRWYAKALGYFWIPCPLCKRDFGGHEAADEPLLDAEAAWVVARIGGAFSGDRAKVVCWRCTHAVRIENARRAGTIVGQSSVVDFGPEGITIAPGESVGFTITLGDGSISRSDS